jgi:uncharacterized protein (TIGR02246 family)
MSTEAVEQHTAAIRRLVDDAQAKQSDVEPFLALHTDDTVVVNFGGRRVAGKDALRRAMTTALASPLAKVTTTAEVQDIRFVRPDVAIVSATKYVADDRDQADTFASKGSMTYVVANDVDAGWRIALAQTTPIAGS